MILGTAVAGARGLERWRRGHPWIYRSDVVAPPETEAGAVRVVDAQGGFQGVALWSPRSEISLRLLTRVDEAIDGGFWTRRLEAALAFRRSLGLVRDAAPGAGQGSGVEPEPPASTAYRLVHGEADGLPSLIIDRYGPVVVVQLLSAGLEAHRREVVEAISELLAPAGVLARNDVPVRSREGLPREVELLQGEVPEELIAVEAGAEFLVRPRAGQKTGAFLDQRENRVRAGGLSRGRVLDCFAYHGSFALHLAGSAAEVTAVDSSAEALERAKRNVELNGLENVRLVEANVFDFLRDAERRGARYDVIVLDPPAFAKHRGALPRALAGYKEINLRAMRLMSPGGHLCTFSCSYHVGADRFREMLVSAAADAGCPMRWVEARGQSADHPELLQIPESGYLKGAILQAGDEGG